MHGWRGPLVDVLVVLCEAVCCGAGDVGVSRVRVCVWLCAGIDYKQRSLEINGKQLRLSIWYVLVCSCLCVQRESGLLDMGMYQRVCASYVCVSYIFGI